MRSTSAAITLAAITSVLAATLSLVATVSVAHASVVKRLSLRELVATSDVIVVARAAHQQARRFGRGNLIVTDVSLQVERVLKGASRVGDPLSVTVLGGQVGRLAMQVPGEATFAAHERVVAFLARSGARGFRVVGMAQGVLTVKDEGGRSVVVPNDSDVALLEPTPAGLRNAPRDPIPQLLSDLVARIAELQRSEVP